MKENALVQLEALLEGAALLMENGKQDAAQGVIYAALDIAREAVCNEWAESRE